MEPVPDNQLCESCSKINILQYFQRAVHSRVDESGFVGPTRDALKLGTVNILYKRSSKCSFCRLVIQAMCNRDCDSDISPEHLVAESQKAQNPIECWLYSYCFAESNLGDVESTKAFRIGIATQMKGEGPCTREERAGDIQLLATDARKAGLSELFYGRIVSTKIDLGLPRSWIRICEREHGTLCEESNTETTSTSPQDLILIDVKRMCLCYPSQQPRYVALSYCWPMTDAFQLSRDTLSEMLEAGSIGRRMKEMPKRIQDAIHLTVDLGENFLWVDALCIVQDSKESKRFQILQMDKIYGSAFLTIVSAASARQSDGIETCEGFPRYNENPDSVKQIVETVQDIHLAVPFDTISMVLTLSRWNSRAWTYEEQLLSKRILYFTGYQVYFQCFCSVFCEDGIAEGSPQRSHICPGSNLYKLGGQSNSDIETDIYGSIHLRRSPYLYPEAALSDYQTYVSGYTSR